MSNAKYKESPSITILHIFTPHIFADINLPRAKYLTCYCHFKLLQITHHLFDPVIRSLAVNNLRQSYIGKMNYTHFQLKLTVYVQLDLPYGMGTESETKGSNIILCLPHDKHVMVLFNRP